MPFTTSPKRDNIPKMGNSINRYRQIQQAENDYLTWHGYSNI